MNRDFVILTAGRVTQIVLSLVSVKVFTSMLEPSEVGKYYLIFTLISLFSQTLINPIGLFFNRHLHRWVNAGKILNYFFLLNLYLLLLSIVAILVITVLHIFVGVGEGLDLGYLNISVMSILVFLTLNQTIIGSLNMLSHRISFVIFSVLTQVITLTLSVIFVKYINASAFAWISGQIVALVIISIASLFYFVKISNSTFDMAESISSVQLSKVSNVMFFTMPLLISSLFIWLQYQSYRLIIEKFVSLEFLGFLGLGFAIASSIYAAVETLIHQLYLPVYYRNINTNDPAQRVAAWNKMAHLIFPIYLSAALLVSALSPFLMTIFASSTYAEAWPYVIFGVWIELFRSVTNTLSSVAHSEMQTRFLIKSYIGGAILAVGATFYCANSGYESLIPAALTLSGLVTLVIMYSEMKKLMAIDIHIRHIAKTLFLSIPLMVSIFLFDQRGNIYSSFMICLILGIYILAVQYKNTRSIIFEV